RRRRRWPRPAAGRRTPPRAGGADSSTPTPGRGQARCGAGWAACVVVCQTGGEVSDERGGAHAPRRPRAARRRGVGPRPRRRRHRPSRPRQRGQLGAPPGRRRRRPAHCRAWRVRGRAAPRGALRAGAGGNVLNAVLRGAHHSAVGASTAVFGAIGLLGGLQFGRKRRRRGAWLPIAGSLALLAMLGSDREADIVAHLFGLLVGGVLG